MMFILLLLGGHQGYISYKDYKKIINKLTKSSQQPKASQISGNTFALFNTPVVSSKSQTVVQSPLNAEVEGIVASDEPWLSFAVIKSSAQQQSYREGDNITGYNDAWIESITRDSVVVNYQGTRQTLALKKPAYFKGATGKEPAEIPKSTLTDLHLSDYFVLKPLMTQGHLEGYLINPRNVSEAYSQAGFIKGDLVVKVDSSDMTNETQARNIIANWSSLRQADVIVRRHDRLHDIQINLTNK